MEHPIFLFHGGNYKRGIDDERLRVPLSPPEIDEVFYDPDVPNDTDNSIGTELDMSRYAELFCDLDKGDEIYIALMPDACLYRGMWAMAFNAVKDYKVHFDLVNARAVWAKWIDKKELKGIAGLGIGTLNYDFSNAVGDSTWDAVTKSKLPYGLPYTDYRNNDALVITPFTMPYAAGLGQAFYVRMTVDQVGDAGSVTDGICCTCGRPKYPTFQFGMIYDRLCVDKQRHQKYCNCDFGLCHGGCFPKDGKGTRYEVFRVLYLDTQGRTLYPAAVVQINEGETKTISPVELANFEEPAAVEVKFTDGKVTNADGEQVVQIEFIYKRIGQP